LPINLVQFGFCTNLVHFRFSSLNKVVERTVRGSGFRVQGSGFRVQGSGFRVQGSGFRVQGSGFRVQGSGTRVEDIEFRGQCLVFTIASSGFGS
jgi:hypothetical protein